MEKGEPGSEITFTMRLAEGDWDEEMRGWRCPVLNVPGSVVDELYVEGARVDKARYEVLRSISMIRWSSNKKPARIAATIKLTKQLSLGSDTERWKKLAIILPVIATIVAAIISGIATYFAAPKKSAQNFQRLGIVPGFGVSPTFSTGVKK